MYRIYLEHGEAYGNLGDEAMLISAADRIRSSLGDVEFVVPVKKNQPLPDIGRKMEIGSVSEYTSKLIRRVFPSRRFRSMVDRVPHHTTFSILGNLLQGRNAPEQWNTIKNEIAKCDGVYFVGAANLNDFARYSCIFPKSILCDIASNLEKPVIISSQTIGPLRLSWTKSYVKKLVQKSGYLSVRDGGISRQLLEEIGIQSSLIDFSGDEAFTLSVSNQELCDEYLHLAGVDPASQFGIIHYRSTDYTSDTKEYFPKIAKAIDQIDIAYKILFLPMSYWSHSGDDRRTGEEIRRYMIDPSRLIILPYLRDVRIAKKIVDMSKWVLSLSYHLQVFSLASTIPFGILFSGDYYAFKAEGMRTLVGPSLPLLNLSRVGSEDVARVIEMLANPNLQLVDDLARAKNLVLKNNDLPIESLRKALT